MHGRRVQGRRHKATSTKGDENGVRKRHPRLDLTQQVELWVKDATHVIVLTADHDALRPLVRRGELQGAVGEQLRANCHCSFSFRAKDQL
eukprot:10114921-Lingulodinium_polyedra.AAC.1